jgi:hypothetical protein
MSISYRKSHLTASYSFKIINGILAITDNDDGQCASVTNAVQSVLTEIAGQLKAPFSSIVIYRDSSGMWDGIRHEGGQFKGFYPIRETDLTVP